MSRLKADLLLALAALIWGLGFIAQKDASTQIGAFTFIACRFLISTLVTWPFAMREGGLRRFISTYKAGDKRKLFALIAAFIAGVTLQQTGIAETTVTNAAFITGIYIVLVPFAAWLLYREAMTWQIAGAGLLSFAGVALLAGANPLDVVSGFNRGDVMTLLCALFFAMQVTLMGHMVGAKKMPFMLSFLQYASITVVTAVLAICFETIDLQAIIAAWKPILYSGIIAGGVAYTLQAVAQQHTPSADAAIIMSAESLFGAMSGMLFLHETLNGQGYLGCLAIFAAIMWVELAPRWRRRLKKAG